MPHRHWQLRRFTLVETMFSSGLSLVMAAILMSLFLFPMRLTQNGITGWLMDYKARVVRERMLQGLTTVTSGTKKWNLGLGDAGLQYMVDQNGTSTGVQNLKFNLDTQTAPTPETNDDTAYLMSLAAVQTNTCLVVGPTSVTETSRLNLLPSSIRPTAAVFQLDAVARTVTGRITLSSTSGGKTYERTVVIRTYIRND